MMPAQRFPTTIVFVCVVILRFLLWGTLPATAGETSPAVSQSLEPMVVTATRTPLDPSTVAANISVVTAEEIERLPAVNVADVLQFVTGVYVEFQGGPGSDAGGIRIQGSEKPGMWPFTRTACP